MQKRKVKENEEKRERKGRERKERERKEKEKKGKRKSQVCHPHISYPSRDGTWNSIFGFPSSSVFRVSGNNQK
jgi:hypothetical protein